MEWVWIGENYCELATSYARGAAIRDDSAWCAVAPETRNDGSDDVYTLGEGGYVRNTLGVHKKTVESAQRVILSYFRNMLMQRHVNEVKELEALRDGQ